MKLLQLWGLRETDACGDISMAASRGGCSQTSGRSCTASAFGSHGYWDCNCGRAVLPVLFSLLFLQLIIQLQLLPLLLFLLQSISVTLVLNLSMMRYDRVVTLVLASNALASRESIIYHPNAHFNTTRLCIQFVGCYIHFPCWFGSWDWGETHQLIHYYIPQDPKLQHSQPPLCFCNGTKSLKINYNITHQSINHFLIKYHRIHSSTLEARQNLTGARAALWESLCSNTCIRKSMPRRHDLSIS